MNSFIETKNIVVESSKRSQNAKRQTGDLGNKGNRSHSIRIAKRKGSKIKTRIGPMRGPSCSGRRRRSCGLADQLPDSYPYFQHVPTQLSALRVSQRKFSSALGVEGKRSPRVDLGGCQLNQLLPKWKQSQRGQQ